MSRILVVDDEPAVRNIMSLVLEHAGYEVLRAEDGVAAYNLIRQRNGDVDLIVTDLKMPRMTGDELVRKVETEYPKVSTVCVSGFTEPPSPKGHHFLPKPFTGTALKAMVQKALGGGHVYSRGQTVGPGRTPQR